MDDREKPSVVFEWGSAEARAILDRHLREDLESGVYSAYLETAKKYYHSDDDQVRSRNMGAELPLVPLVHEFGGDRSIALARINPDTGETVDNQRDTPGFSESKAKVCILEGSTNKLHDLSPGFSEEQARLVIRHADELKEVGLEIPFVRRN